MKLCFPVVQDQGLDSEVYGHFGSAPYFLIVDAATGQINLVDNSDKVHEHGACNPAKAVAGLEVDGIVVAVSDVGRSCRLTVPVSGSFRPREYRSGTLSLLLVDPGCRSLRRAVSAVDIVRLVKISLEGAAIE